MQKKYFYSFFTFLTLISYEKADSMSMIWGLSPIDMRAKIREHPQKVRFMPMPKVVVQDDESSEFLLPTQNDFKKLSIAEQWAKLEELVKMLSSFKKVADEASLTPAQEQEMQKIASDLMEKCNIGSSSDSLLETLQMSAMELTKAEQTDFSDRIWNLAFAHAGIIQNIRNSLKEEEKEQLKPGQSTTCRASLEVNKEIAELPTVEGKVLKYKYRKEHKFFTTYDDIFENSIFALKLSSLPTEAKCYFNQERLHFNFDTLNPLFYRADTLLTKEEYLVFNRDFPYFEEIGRLLEFLGNINSLMGDLEKRHTGPWKIGICLNEDALKSDIERPFWDILLEDIDRVRGNEFLRSMNWNEPEVDENETRIVVQLLKLIKYLYPDPTNIISLLKAYFDGTGDTRPGLPPLPERKSSIAEIKASLENEKNFLESLLIIPETFDARLDYILDWDGQGNSLIDNFNLDKFLEFAKREEINIFTMLKFGQDDFIRMIKYEYGDLLELLKHEALVAVNRANLSLLSFIIEVINKIYDTKDAYVQYQHVLEEMFDVQNAVRTAYLIYGPMLALAPDYEINFNGGFWNNIIANFKACQINLMKMNKQKLKSRPGRASTFELPDGGPEESVVRDLVGHSVLADKRIMDCGTRQFFDGRLTGLKCMFNSVLQFPLKNNQFNGIFHFNGLLESSLKGYYDWLVSHRMEHPAIKNLISILTLDKSSSSIMPNMDYAHPIFNYLLGMNVFIATQDENQGDVFVPNPYGPTSYVYNEGNTHFKLLRNGALFDIARITAEGIDTQQASSSSAVSISTSPWAKKIRPETYFAFGNQSYLDSLATVHEFRQLWIEGSREKMSVFILCLNNYRH